MSQEDDDSEDVVAQALTAAIKMFKDAHPEWQQVEWVVNSYSGTADVDWYAVQALGITEDTLVSNFDAAITAAGLAVVWGAEITGTRGELIITRECKLAVPLVG